ncbi:MAG: ABC transporter ATP-binding protein, partial [Deltaproteobacteria bacterium]|nr:ABC transporter ATP-binding protein [Deltaproteobacteria bacterium]
LCQRVGIIDKGEIIALDTPSNLIANTGLKSSIEFSVSQEDSKKILQGLKGIGKVTQQSDNKFILNTKESSKTLKELTRFSDKNNINMDNISVRKATLEDVFLSLTGRGLRE